MSQQPDSSPRITRRLETPPVEPATTSGDGSAGPRVPYPEPQNLYQAITRGIESALRDFGVDLGCPPAVLSGHVMRELKRIPGWRPPARVIECPAELEALPTGTIVQSNAGTIACRFNRVRGVVFGSNHPFDWDALQLPATVLWTPGGEA
jgi:hypothetical protein